MTLCKVSCSILTNEQNRKFNFIRIQCLITICIDEKESSANKLKKRINADSS